MVALSLSVRRICLIALLLALYVLFALVGKAKGQVIAPATQAQTKAQVKGQAAASAAAAGTTAAAANATSATAVWTVKMSGDIRWQQITPAGALLVATDGSLAGVDIDRGTVAWEKPELGGIAADSIRPMEDSLLMIAERPGLLMIFDPVTGAVVFDSRKLELTKVITRRVLPQSGTLLVHGLRAGQGNEAPPWSRSTIWRAGSSCG